MTTISSTSTGAGATSGAGTSGAAVKWAWAAAVLLFLWLLVAPIHWGLNVSNDDLKFVRGNLNVGSLAENIRHGWLHTNSFRPLENIVASFCDPRTLWCWPVLPVQFTGMALLALGVVALARRVLPAAPIAAPLILIWIELSPSTMTSLWQMDTCSQTWVAALGLWCGILTWDLFAAARRGGSIGGTLALLFVIAAVAMNVKETFFGWSAAIGAGVIVAIAACRGMDRRATLRAALALLPVAVMPLIYLVIRYKFGGLGGVAPIDEAPEGRYQIGLGENILTNALMSMFGIFSNGPLHIFNDEAAMLPLRALPVLSLLASGGVLIAAGALRILHRKTPGHVPLRRALLAACVCMFSVVVTLPMGAVSDLYGFGPNIGSGLLIVTAGLMLWNPADDNDRFIGRFIAAAAMAVLCVVGLYGVAGRTYQFSMTWYYAREINRIVLDHQAALPPGKPGEAAACVYFPQNCYSGHIYGSVMIRPLQSMGIDSIGEWINRADPKHPIRFLMTPPSTLRPGFDLVVDCSKFPARQDW
ncbi:MAG: hypothetical protein K8R92_12190 [Planctomycetes bacterium]|nr:hypothetical protein [Planctomycetota bacterium]